MDTLMDIQRVMAMEDSFAVTAKNGAMFRLRRLHRDDVDSLRRFNDRLGSDRERFTPHAYDEKTLHGLLRRSERGEDLLLGLFLDTDDGSEGDCIGYFFLWYFQERVPLLGIGILSDYQGIGLGSRTLRFLIAQAKYAGCEAVELTTLPENHEAFALYERCGFDYFGDVENLDGSGRKVIERAMLYRIKEGAAPMDRPHAPPSFSEQ